MWVYKTCDVDLLDDDDGDGDGDGDDKCRFQLDFFWESSGNLNLFFQLILRVCRSLTTVQTRRSNGTFNLTKSSLDGGSNEETLFRLGPHATRISISSPSIVNM